ncbi:MAG: Uncharacterized protein XE05_0292 [Thermotogales bacterium 46_20]|nr:MAG: Uncharacterized protein XE05_0292 [Thermotogales bacterium 46_20]
MIRRILLVPIILLVISCAFSFDTDAVEQYFLGYIEDFQKVESQHPLVKELKLELDNLALYRLYKFQIAGSVERRETSTTIAGLLTDFFRTIPESAYANQDDRLAFSAFLGWVLSEYSVNSFETWTLSEMPAFTRAFNDYTAYVRNAASKVFKAWIAHALGVLVEIPEHFPEELSVRNVFPELAISVAIDKEDEELISSLSSPGIINRLTSSIDQIAEKNYTASELFKEDVRHFVNLAINDLPGIDQSLLEQAQNLLELWVYHAMSLIDHAPGFPAGMMTVEATIPGFDNTLPTDEEYYSEILAYFEENPDRRASTAERLGLNARILSMRRYDPSSLLESDIEAEVRRIVPALTEAFTALRAEISENLVEAAERSPDLAWLRILIYVAAGLGLYLLMPALRSYLAGAIVSVELFYLLFFSNFNLSTFDVSLYAIVIVPTFVFTLILTVSANLSKTKRGILSLLQLLLVILVLVLPFTNLYTRVDEISMDEFPNFYSSIYYETLKTDLFLSTTSRFSFLMRDLTSVISTEMNDLRRVIRVVIPNVMNSIVSKSNSQAAYDAGRFRITMPSFDPYLSISNQQEYVQEFDSLQKNLKSFVRTSTINYRTYLKRKDAVMSSAVQIVAMAGEPLREDFLKHVRDAFGARADFTHPLEVFEDTIHVELEKEPEPASVKPYSSGDFAPILLGVMVLSSSSALFKRRVLFLYVQMALIVVAFVRALLSMGSLELFVHSGLPEISVVTSSRIDIWFLVFFVCIISVCLIKAILSHKKRREIHED